MSIFNEVAPTAGFPIPFKDLFFSKRQGNLEKYFCDYLGLEFTRVTYSGTAALYIILEGLKSLSAKRTVVIPSYVCPLVALAVKKSGLKVRVCDIEKDNFNFDYTCLERLCLQDNDILAVVAVHLAGIPVELKKLSNLAGEKDFFLIEDCAQGLGAEIEGKKIGTFGDFAFFSLCRGKGLTIYEGGVIVAKNGKHFPIIDNQIKKIVRNNFFSESLKILELIGYSIFYRKQLFWFIFSLPQLFWNALGKKNKAMIEDFGEDFPVHGVSKFRQDIAVKQFLLLDCEISSQREKALYYISELRGLNGLKLIGEVHDTRATFPYLALLFKDAAKRRRAFELFSGSGLGVSTIYNCPITEYDYLKGFVPEENSSNAHNIASLAITVSTSKFLSFQEQDEVIKKIKQALL